ncbi:autotransporter family protein [Pseudomonas sp. 31 E 5]|nr:autotransporter outer membrane beta-barrel domain-containing protein [Pseudomonas sp. 31 E 5]CRM51654.1 Fluffing protein [Pseudomonas sp. 31 E 5]
MRTRTLSLYLGIALTLALATWPLASRGACSVNNTAGDDISNCDSATAPGFTDTGGNNTLTLTATGRIAGNVSYGDGNDRVNVNGPNAGIDGNLDQGHGNNFFRLDLGSITGEVHQGDGKDVIEVSGGKAGAMVQGSGQDRFVMTDGTIASLAQGDGLDEFEISGGTITGAFEDGDHGTMTGGTIGRVDMKLDDNVFKMSAGTIVGNLVTGFGKDTIEVSGTSVIGGNISVSGGGDRVTVSGGEVKGQVLLSFGNDRFTWTGGNLHAPVMAGPGDDTASLHNLTRAQLAAAQWVDGGLGNDTLTLDNTQAGDPAVLPNWETIDMRNGAQLSLGGTLKLGDSASGTGTLNLDSTSELQAATGVIEAFTPGQRVNVNNSGLINMAAANAGTGDTLTINGNYTGNGGRLALNSRLDGDGSPSDRLVVSQGSLDGTTRLNVINAGGAGAATLQDGIQVVQALNGATSSATAFSLEAPLSAGAYEYHLFQGGVTPGTADNFYLRSTLPAAPQVVPAPGTPPLPASTGGAPTPFYRPEVSIYAALFPATEQMVRGMLGTFHERMGDQSQQRQSGAFQAGWGRVYGSSARQSFAGTVSPTLDRSLFGFQVGSDLYAGTTANGHVQRSGFFVGHSTLKGNVKGFNGGWQDKDAGKTTLRGDSLGVYWTLIGANQAYLDLVLMGTRFNGNNESNRGVKMKTRGHNLTASAEIGWPLPVTRQWVVEPQAQVIVGKTRLDSQNDGISRVSYEADTTLTTRLGVRLRGDYQWRSLPFQPYARANVWHSRAGQNTATFEGQTAIDTEQQASTLDVSVGATLKVAEHLSIYGEAGYRRNLDSQADNGRQGTLGLRMAF